MNLSSNLGDILSKTRAKPSGNGYIGHCPAHDDRNPSLSINEVENKILLHCHAGCLYEDIKAQLGLEAKVIPIKSTASKKAQSNWLPSFPVKPPDKIVHATYGKPDLISPYKTKDGQLLTYVCRWNEEKTGGRKQIMPYTYGTLDGKLGWYFRSPAPPYYPYNLPDILENPNAFFLFVEGEKTANAATKLFGLEGFVVTTTIFASGGISKTDFSAFANKMVFIWRDNDDVGKGYCEKLIVELEKVNAIIHIVVIPENFPIAWDLADPLPEGLEMADLWLMLERAKPHVKLEVVEATIAQKSKKESKSTKSKSPSPVPGFVADEFLNAEYPMIDGYSPLCCYHDEFYFYNGKHYEKKRESLLDEIVKFMRTTPDYQKFAKKGFVSDVLMHVRAIVGSINYDTALPFYRSSPRVSLPYLVALKNGILDINAAVEGASDLLTPHNPNFFSLNSLDFDFDPNAKCPNFEQYLKSSVPDPDVRATLIEFLGYCFQGDNKYEKALLLIGEGANGKSVFTSIAGYLLGSQNISHLGLEGFDNKGFALSKLIGKKANICADLSEVNKISEGVLKQVISGDPITVDRKHLPMMEFTPTTKLIFSTNNLPRFSDRSKAMYRRLIIVDFKITFDESSQNERYKTFDFWLPELPAIFLLALEGLASLRRRGQFIKSEEGTKLLEEYQLENNPAAMFLTECYEVAGITEKVSSMILYQAYQDYCRTRGFQSMNTVNFTKELKRIFPQAILTPNPIHFHNENGVKIKARAWQGIARREDAPQDPRLTH